LTKGLSLASIVAGVVLATSAAHAEEGDGAYGRLAGDVTLVTGLGGGYVLANDRPFFSADVRARYIDAAGALLFYEEADAFRKATEVGTLRRAFGAGIEFRPLFPIRFLKAWESGRGFVDLVLDSFGLELAAYFAAIEGSSAQRPGIHVGLGVEAPLAGGANGPWVRLGAAVRWTSARLEGDTMPASRVAVLTIGLAWHQVIGSGAVDRHDRHLARPSWVVPNW